MECQCLKAVKDAILGMLDALKKIQNVKNVFVGGVPTKTVMTAVAKIAKMIAENASVDIA